MKKEIDVIKRECKRCGHAWYKRIEQEPVTCPKCHSPYWDKPRTGDPDG